VVSLIAFGRIGVRGAIARWGLALKRRRVLGVVLA
jgi:hypothetical protein